MYKIHLSILFPLVILLLILIYPINYPIQSPKLYALTHKAKISDITHKKVIKPLNPRYLEITPHPFFSNPLKYTSKDEKFMIELMPWGEASKKDYAVGLQLKIEF